MPANPIIWRPQDSRLDWERADLEGSLAKKASVIPFMELNLRQQALQHQTGFDWANLDQANKQFGQELTLKREGFEFGVKQARQSALSDFVENVLPRLGTKSREIASEAVDELYTSYGLQPRFAEGEEEQPLNLRLGETGQDVSTRLTERELADRELRTTMQGERDVASEMNAREVADIKREDVRIDKILRERQLDLREKALSEDTRIANAQLEANITKMRQGDANAAVDVLKLNQLLLKDDQNPLDPTFLQLAIQVLTSQFASLGNVSGQSQETSRVGITAEDKKRVWGD